MEESLKQHRHEMPPHPQPDHPSKTEHTLFSSPSLHLLRKRTRQMSNSITTHDTKTEPEKETPSMTEIIKIAAAKFIDSAEEPADPDQPSGNSDEDDDDDVELVHLLLRAADELDHKQYEEATHLLDLCDVLSSKEGNLAQRVTHYFVQALREKLRNETAATSPDMVSDLINELQRLTVEETITATCPFVAVMYEKIPFFQVGQLAGIQAIFETVERSKRVHVIDLRIRNGMQWTALMQALSSPTVKRRRNLEMLKITAIVTTNTDQLVRGTGERLARFAESMNIPFAFQSVVVSSLVEIDETKFDLDPKEIVTVFGEYALQRLIPEPTQLEKFMEVMKKIQPNIMVVIETEANLNSYNFGHRFVEVLFHCGAFFDCVDVCFDVDDGGAGGDRGVMESMFLRNIVKELLVKEGKEMLRGVTVDMWRKFFGQFSMWEASLSSSAMDTVNLLLGRFVGGKFCTLDMNGSSLVVGWKGTPVLSISAWKFLHFKTTETNPERDNELYHQTVEL